MLGVPEELAMASRASNNPLLDLYGTHEAMRDSSLMYGNAEV